MKELKITVHLKEIDHYARSGEYILGFRRMAGALTPLGVLRYVRHRDGTTNFLTRDSYIENPTCYVDIDEVQSSIALEDKE